MDNIVTDKADVKNYRFFYLVLLLSLTAIFIALGMKISGESYMFTGSSFYKRYDGVTDSIPSHLSASVICSSVAMIQLLAIYLASYSPFLLPICGTVTAFRGFVAGTAYNAVSSEQMVVQVAVYTVITGIICTSSAMMYSCKKTSVHLKRAVLLLFSAGICVTAEMVLSYVI